MGQVWGILYHNYKNKEPLNLIIKAPIVPESRQYLLGGEGVVYCGFLVVLVVLVAVVVVVVLVVAVVATARTTTMGLVPLVFVDIWCSYHCMGIYAGRSHIVCYNILYFTGTRVSTCG